MQVVHNLDRNMELGGSGQHSTAQNPLRPAHDIQPAEQHAMGTRSQSQHSSFSDALPPDQSLTRWQPSGHVAPTRQPSDPAMGMRSSAQSRLLSPGGISAASPQPARQSLPAPLSQLHQGPTQSHHQTHQPNVLERRAPAVPTDPARADEEAALPCDPQQQPRLPMQAEVSPKQQVVSGNGWDRPAGISGLPPKGPQLPISAAATPKGLRGSESGSGGRWGLVSPGSVGVGSSWASTPIQARPSMRNTATSAAGACSLALHLPNVICNEPLEKQDWSRLSRLFSFSIWF